MPRKKSKKVCELLQKRIESRIERYRRLRSNITEKCEETQEPERNSVKEKQSIKCKMKNGSKSKMETHESTDYDKKNKSHKLRNIQEHKNRKPRSEILNKTSSVKQPEQIIETPKEFTINSVTEITLKELQKNQERNKIFMNKYEATTEEIQNDSQITLKKNKNNQNIVPNNKLKSSNQEPIKDEVPTEANSLIINEDNKNEESPKTNLHSSTTEISGDVIKDNNSKHGALASNIEPEISKNDSKSKKIKTTESSTNDSKSLIFINKTPEKTSLNSFKDDREITKTLQKSENIKALNDSSQNSKSKTEKKVHLSNKNRKLSKNDLKKLKILEKNTKTNSTLKSADIKTKDCYTQTNSKVDQNVQLPKYVFPSPIGRNLEPAAKKLKLPNQMVELEDSESSTDSYDEIQSEIEKTVHSPKYVFTGATSKDNNETSKPPRKETSSVQNVSLKSYPEIKSKFECNVHWPKFIYSGAFAIQHKQIPKNDQERSEMLQKNLKTSPFVKSKNVESCEDYQQIKSIMEQNVHWPKYVYSAKISTSPKDEHETFKILPKNLKPENADSYQQVKAIIAQNIDWPKYGISTPETRKQSSKNVQEKPKIPQKATKIESDDSDTSYDSSDEVKTRIAETHWPKSILADQVEIKHLPCKVNEKPSEIPKIVTKSVIKTKNTSIDQQKKSKNTSVDQQKISLVKQKIVRKPTKLDNIENSDDYQQIKSIIEENIYWPEHISSCEIENNSKQIILIKNNNTRQEQPNKNNLIQAEEQANKIHSETILVVPFFDNIKMASEFSKIKSTDLESEYKDSTNKKINNIKVNAATGKRDKTGKNKPASFLYYDSYIRSIVIYYSQKQLIFSEEELLKYIKERIEKIRKILHKSKMLKNTFNEFIISKEPDKIVAYDFENEHIYLAFKQPVEDELETLMKSNNKKNNKEIIDKHLEEKLRKTYINRLNEIFDAKSFIRKFKIETTNQLRKIFLTNDNLKEVSEKLKTVEDMLYYFYLKDLYITDDKTDYERAQIAIKNELKRKNLTEAKQLPNSKLNMQRTYTFSFLKFLDKEHIIAPKGKHSKKAEIYSHLQSSQFLKARTRKEWFHEYKDTKYFLKAQEYPID